MTPKKIGKNILCWLLERQVKRLRRDNEFKIVAVAGSVGKTSTKLAIAKTLSASRRVCYQEGNYNDRLTVPLVLFGHEEPGIYNVFAWAGILLRNRRQLERSYPYDIVVLEMGSDAPGQMKKFAYLRPELTVITAVADEHMDSFKTLDRVAQEELLPLVFSANTLLNIDDTPRRYWPRQPYLSYGFHGTDYRLIAQRFEGLKGQQLTCRLPGGEEIKVETHALGDQGAKIVLAAVAAAHQLGLGSDEIKQAVTAITPVAGRMQILDGRKNSLLIDDTYNASPVAVKAALKVLESVAAPQRIAILGSMNELGTDSPALHTEIGAACDPQKIDLVVTIGQQAGAYLAPAAKQRGCTVKTYLNPRQAGEYVRRQLKPKAVVLAKGSQNGVFAEEALKPLLADPDDAVKLVRQSDYWLKRKRAQFD